MEQQIELIQAELAIAHGKVNTVEEYIQKTRTMSWLLHADEIVDEANSIAQAFIENDLFFNPPTDITIGKAKFPLNSLAQTGWIEASFGIREEGEPLIIVGKLRIKARLMNIVNVLGSNTQLSSILPE
ncbi:MAG: hypothetical protein EZS28_001794 [Streblomastix strix]|uniref:Uncharacterized protein n=1 Tax=Streblomastix strix TaxID=222440 RepID=A0A5J4X606_9EUKA|nr:MAG: hypothetical protein EZS28_001794 [Streblomastix strix]